ncbi:MAG TPA: methyltransferase domain-containing protein [Longimicrobiaceae bacterium]|nr:methyltransferase domain-containing protein [Longimicrobiaceae bacterium]
MTDSAANEPVDLFDTTYANFRQRVHEQIRRDTFGEDIVQNSWLVADEARELFEWMRLDPTSTVLEVAVGSGGPALFMARTTGAGVVGIDVNEHGITAANEMARAQGLELRVRFRCADAGQPLPFEDGSFDALVCIDSVNHFPGRLAVLREWHRVLRPGGRLVYTDAIVVTGLLTNEEIAARSSIGYFLFGPVGENERLIREAGFELLRAEDRTEAVAQVSGRWHDSRAAHRDDLLQIEGEDTFEGLQRFFAAVHALSSERRLSRYAFLAVR